MDVNTIEKYLLHDYNLISLLVPSSIQGSDIFVYLAWVHEVDRLRHEFCNLHVSVLY